MVKVKPGSVTLPTRVKEQRYERDDQRREAVPLLEGEGRLVVKKLAGGAYGVRKVIEFWKQKGRGPAQVETTGGFFVTYIFVTYIFVTYIFVTYILVTSKREFSSPTFSSPTFW